MNRFDEFGAGFRGVAVEKAIDAGQDDEMFGLYHLGDLGGQPVVVADADFLGRDCVVFVDDRQHVRAQQPVQGILCIEEPTMILEIAQRDEDLRDVDVISALRQ